MQDQHLFPEIPSCTWNRPIGLGWDKPYTVRNPSNLDDGPGTECPCGFCRLHRPFTRRLQPVAHRWGRAYFESIPVNSASSSSQLTHRRKLRPCTEPPVNGTQRAWQWYPASKGSSEQERTSPTLNTGTYHALIRAVGLSTKECFKPSSSVSSFPRSGLRTTKKPPGSSL